jgi:transcriptional regulator with XRE-family HTH domain
MKMGARLASERKKRNLTTETLAEKCGVSRSYITLIENGLRLPSKKVLPKIADALQLELETLLEWYLNEVEQRLKEDLGSKNSPKNKYFQLANGETN